MRYRRSVAGDVSVDVLFSNSLSIAYRSADIAPEHGRPLGRGMRVSRWAARDRCTHSQQASDSTHIGLLRDYPGLLACRFFLGLFEGRLGSISLVLHNILLTMVLTLQADCSRG